MQFDVNRFFSDTRSKKYVKYAEHFLIIPEICSAILFFFDENDNNKIFTSGNLHPSLFKDTSLQKTNSNPGDEETIIRHKLNGIYSFEQLRFFNISRANKVVGKIFLGVSDSFNEDHFKKAKDIGELISLEIKTDFEIISQSLKENNIDAFFKLGLISTDIFLELSPTGNIEYINKAFNNSLGYTRDLVIGKNILDFVFDDDLATGTSNLKDELLGRRYLNDWRGRLLSYDNKKIWFSITGISIDNRWYAIARDINDLIYFDHQLIKERERFKFFTESSFEGIGLEIDGIIIDCNRRYLNIFEADLSDIIKQPSDKFLLIENPKKWKETIENEAIATYEIMARTKTGEIVHLEVNRKPTFHKGQKGKLVALRDITKRKQLEKELYKRNEFHRSVIENNHILFGLVDAQGNISELSNGVLELLCTKQKDVIGKPLHEILGCTILPKDDPKNNLVTDPKTNTKIFRLAKNSPTYQTEVEVNNTNCSPLTLSFSLDELSGDKSANQIVVFKDVTSLKANINKLELAEDELKNTIKSAKLASWYYDFDSWSLKLSPESKNVLDLDKFEFEFDEFFSKIHPDDVEETAKEMQKALEGQEFSIDTRIVLNNKPRYVNIQSFAAQAPINNTHKPVIKGIIQDVSERKKQEIELKEAKQNAEKHTRAKNLFLANMSHEIRTPLNSILGFSQILENKIDNDDAKKLLGSIKNSGDTLLKLINDILDLSKIESSKIVLHNEDFTIRKLIEYQNSLFKNIAFNKQISFEINTILHRAHQFYGDFYRINQVLMNLINNAVKFTHNGSVRLEIAFEPKHENNGYLYFRIIDTGIGIEPKAQSQIFQTFEQANSEITKNFGGTGLGLAIVKGLVEMMGGSITVESEVGYGTTFHVKVEVTNKEIVPRSERIQTPSISRKTLHVQKPFRVLLAEDNATNQLLMEEVFSQLGIEFVIADDGIIALNTLKKDHNFQLGIFDIQMPNLDGTGAIKAIRSAPEIYPQFPIIALTADATTQEKNFALENGFDDFLPKPFIINELIASINALMETSNANDEKPRTKVSSTGTNKSWVWTIDLAYIKEVTHNNDEAILKILQRCCTSLPEKIVEMVSAFKKEDKKSILDNLHAIKGQITLFIGKEDQNYIANQYQKIRDLNQFNTANSALFDTLVAELTHLKTLLSAQYKSYEEKVSNSG